MSDKSLNHQLLHQVLTKAFDRAMNSLTEGGYCLVGTSAALLHGVVLPAGDIDILVKERASVDAFARVLAEFECLMSPTELTDDAQYFFECVIDDVGFSVSTVEVETESEFMETLGEGPWKHSTLIPCGSHHIRTVDLELRLATELGRQRPDRYEPLIEWMQIKGCDHKLLRNAMTAWHSSESKIESVLKQIGTDG